jgi:hypothetical protein
MGSSTGVCKNCGQTKKLVKAHIIPRKFFEVIRGTGYYSALIDATKPLKQAATYYQAGAHDTSILCEDCERKFSDFDKYGWQILGNPDLSKPLPDHSGHKLVCDTGKIRRFILSILWRASVSRNSFYSSIDLGSDEATVKERVFNSTPLGPDEYQMAAVRVDARALGDFSGVLFQPFSVRNHHILFLPGGLRFMTITGKDTFPPEFHGHLIGDPASFSLIYCPKKFMIERDYVPQMIDKLRKAEGIEN